MTQDEIIRMATECGFKSSDCYKLTVHHTTIETLTRFAELVAAAEREACAKAVEDMAHGNVKTCAAAIRARGNT